jgi:hypothetical protein
MAKVVEHLPGKCRAPEFKLQYCKKKKKVHEYEAHVSKFRKTIFQTILRMGNFIQA